MTPDPIDTDLKDRLRQWQVETLDASAADRLISAAMARPQLRSWPQRAIQELELSLSSWTYGLAYKLTAAAGCLAFGAGLGGGLAQPASSIAGIALMLEGMVAS